MKLNLSDPADRAHVFGDDPLGLCDGKERAREGETVIAELRHSATVSTLSPLVPGEGGADRERQRR